MSQDSSSRQGGTQHEGEIMSETTALERAALAAPSDEQIAQLRAKGTSLVQYKRELNELTRMIEGLEWGSGNQVVKGSNFSVQTRYALAQLCRITGANPMTHIDILGGRPYFNATFWSDRISSDAYFHHFQQESLSPSTEKGLREKAKKFREDAAALKEGNPVKSAEMLTQAIDQEGKADWMAEERRAWDVPEWAQVVVLTTVYRFMEAAPIEQIKSGEIRDFERYLIRVEEVNYAGGRPKERKKNRQTGEWYEYQSDPVGEAEPSKTARTRSLRRCASRAFSAWMQQYEKQISKAEKAVEAEFEVVEEQKQTEAEVLPGSGEPQAVATGAGEPSAARADQAQDLPEVGAEPPQAEPTEEEKQLAAPPPFDRADWHRKYFALLKEAGIDDRVRWQVDNYLPESTKKWEEFNYRKACGILEELIREGAEALAEANTPDHARESLDQAREEKRQRDLGLS